VTWIRSHRRWTLLALFVVLVLLWLWTMGLLVSFEYET
jgi:hypothetical protein